jgi:hypothetical protein
MTARVPRRAATPERSLEDAELDVKIQQMIAARLPRSSPEIELDLQKAVVTFTKERFPETSDQIKASLLSHIDTRTDELMKRDREALISTVKRTVTIASVFATLVISIFTFLGWKT